jgi:predicted acetyltransferase
MAMSVKFLSPDGQKSAYPPSIKAFYEDLSRSRCVWLLDGVRIGFIDHLYTPHGTTSNYSAIANHHKSHAKLFSSCLHQPFHGNGF